MYVLVLVFVFLVLIRPQDYPVWAGAQGLPLQPAALLGAAGLWAMSRHRSLGAPQYLLVVLFMLALMLSWVANGWATGVMMVLERFGPVVVAFVMLAQAVHTRERVVGMMGMFTICACVLALHGIEQAQTGIGWTGTGLSQGTRIQYVGIFNDPNDLGMLFVMCLPMAMYLRGRTHASALGRLFWLAVAGILVYGIYLTNSRGTLLALIGLFGVHVWLRRGMLVAGVLGVCSLGLVMLLPSRLQELDVSEASAMGRVEAWYHGLQLFISSPVLGIGPGGYSDGYGLTAHNSLLLVLAEAGIVGFTLYLAILGYTLRMLLATQRGWAGAAAGPQDYAGGPQDWEEPLAVEDAEELQAREADMQEDRAIARTLLLSFCGLMITAFFLSRSYVVLPYMLLALITAQYSRMQLAQPELPRFSLVDDALRWPLLSLVSVVALYVIVKILLVIA
jgi:putative inorganic carbon (HCO3(-)) transporter